MANMKEKDKTIDSLALYIKDPKLQDSFASMPAYDLKEENLQNLSEFILSLDFSRNKEKVIKKEDILGKIELSKKP